jgi:hypothetical protein
MRSTMRSCCVAWHSGGSVALCCRVTVAMHREWFPGGRCIVVALQPPGRTSCRHLMRRLPHVLQLYDDGLPW